MIYILLTLIVTMTTIQQDRCTTFAHTLLSHSQENLCEIKGAVITRASILTQ